MCNDMFCSVKELGGGREGARFNMGLLKWKWLNIYKVFCSTSGVDCAALQTKGAQFLCKTCDMLVLFSECLYFLSLRFGLKLSNISGASYSQWCKRNPLVFLSVGISTSSPHLTFTYLCSRWWDATTEMLQCDFKRDKSNVGNSLIIPSLS